MSKRSMSGLVKEFQAVLAGLDRALKGQRSEPTGTPLDVLSNNVGFWLLLVSVAIGIALASVTLSILRPGV